MKKVWIGLGVGCGTLVLLAIIGVVGVGWYAKQKLGGAIAAGEQMQKQEQRLQALNQKFAFTPPAEGRVMALEPKRLEAYLAIREAGLPVFADFEKKAEAFKQETQGDQASIGDAMKGAGMLMELTTQVREAFIASLEQHGMSPAEFHATTQAIYSTAMGQAVQGMNEAMAQASDQMRARIEELDTKLEDAQLPEAERQALQTERDALHAQVESMGQGAQGAVQTGLAPGQDAEVTANATLLETHKARIETAANPAFDMFILGGGAGELATPSAE